MAFTPVNLLIAMVLVLGLNSALVRLGLAARFPALYWIVQGMNAAIVVGVLVWGVPGLRGQAKLINWIIALVVSMHVVQNVSARMAAQSEARRASLDAEWEALNRRAQERRFGPREAGGPGDSGGPTTSSSAPTDPIG